LGVEEEVHKIRARLLTRENGIGGVVVKPLFLRTSEAGAVIKDVGVGPEAPAVWAVSAVIRLGSEGRRVISREAVSCDHLKCCSL
jgi:hypothetical protein